MPAASRSVRRDVKGLTRTIGPLPGRLKQGEVVFDPIVRRQCLLDEFGEEDGFLSELRDDRRLLSHCVTMG